MLKTTVGYEVCQQFKATATGKILENHISKNLILPISIARYSASGYKPVTNAAFTHAGLTTTYRMESLHISIFVLSSSRYILFVKRIESLLNIELGNPLSQTSGIVPGHQNR